MVATAALVFAGKSVATPAISFLVNKAFIYLNEYRKAEGLGEMKTRILRALPKIQAVFDVVKPEHVKEQSRALDAWLWQLRDAVEEAEDAVDEVEYYELEEKAKDRKVSDWGSSFDKMKHKAVKSVKQAPIVGKVVKDLTHSGTLKRLWKAVESLDKAAAGVADFLALADHLKGHTTQEQGFQNRDRETGSMLTESQVFGRHKELKLVVGWLTKKPDQHNEIEASNNDVSVVSIVAHGGMGKTTLAQLVWKNEAVIKHFEKVIWVCVSTIFDAKTIIGNILESATWETSNAKTLEALQKILKEKVETVKFLLVLDDVWDDKKKDQWNNLFAPLRNGRNGSKILLTTRMQSVADLAAHSMRGQNEWLALQGLEEEENAKLFNHHAFPSGTFQDYKALQPIGEQIAMNVRGCPLVTKVVASHLRDNLTFPYWNNFLRQRLEHFEGSADDIMDVLKLSYYQLPADQQTCFRYCSIFPQDYKFRKNELVEMWMSSGLIAQDTVGSGSSLSDIGEQYLAQLTRKSFFDFRLAEDDYDQLIEGSACYVMHDLMHDLARCVSLGECAQIIGVSSLENVVSTVRHISFKGIYDIPVEKIMGISRLENLRTIVIQMYGEHVSKDVLNALEELVLSSKSLRIFQTGLLHTSHFLGKLAMLKHVRFLKLEEIQPESVRGIAKLYHLTTLYYSRSAVIEPKQLRDVGNLDRLRYVRFGNDFPVGRLSSLQELICYRIVEGYTISALKDLKSLRELDVQNLGNVENHEEAKQAKLKEKPRLESLSLGWSELGLGKKNRNRYPNPKKPRPRPN